MSSSMTRFEMAQACTNTFAQPDVFEVAPEGSFEESFVYSALDEAGQITERLYATFRNQAEVKGYDDMPWLVVWHGYSVAGNGIMMCVSAYQRYCRESNTSYQVDDFKQGISNPKTLEFFTDIAKMSNDENAPYESYFSLRGSTMRADFGEFFYDPAQQCFLPNKEFLFGSRLEAARARALRAEEGSPVQDSERCPATRFIPHVWAALARAYEEAGLFSAKAEAQSMVKY